MINRSKKNAEEVVIGDCISLPTEAVNRGPTGPKNIICRIVDYNEVRGLYEIACGAGVIERLVVRNNFEKISADFSDTIKIRTDIKVGIREAIRVLSIGGGQGMLKCECKLQCQKRCKCKSAGLLCNSRCHGGNNKCTNK